MRTLVFGSGGYAGRRVLAALAERDVDVLGVDVAPISDYVHERCDLSASGEASALMYRWRPDVAINLAYALAAQSSAHPQRALRINILGVNEIFQAANDLGTPRVISVSSGAVYGDNADHAPDAVMDEETVRTPRTLYGHMKSLNEAVAERYNGLRRTTIVSLRLPTLHGHGKTGTFAPLDMIVEGARSGQAVTLPWGRSQRFCFIHVDDAARAIVELALAPAPRWTTYNTGGEEMTIGGLIEIAESICGIPIETEEPGRVLLNTSRVSGNRLANEFNFTRGRVQDWLRLELAARLAEIEAEHRPKEGARW